MNDLILQTTENLAGLNTYVQVPQRMPGGHPSEDRVKTGDSEVELVQMAIAACADEACETAYACK